MLVLGTANFKTAPAGDLINYALAQGILAIDTADSYGTEEIVSDILKGRKVRLSTKVGNPSTLGRGLSKEHIRKSCDQSLLNLKVDCIDLYYTHCWDPETPLTETLGILADLIAEGKVKEIGCSNLSQEQLDEALAVSEKYSLPRFSCLQAPVNLIERTHPKGLPIVAYSPLAGGVLTGKYLNGIPEESRATLYSYEPRSAGYVPKLTDTTREITKEVVEQAKLSGLTPSQFSLNWVLQQPGVTSVVIGASNLNQLKELI